jgi:hypothetical protein
MSYEPKYDRMLPDDASLQLIRTNPKLTGNLKITVDSNGDVWFNSIEINDELSKESYKRYPIDINMSHTVNVKQFFKNNKTSNTHIFEVGTTVNPIEYTGDFKDQYDMHYYSSCARTFANKFYTEHVSYMAPIYLKKRIPKYFIVFKIKNAMNHDAVTSKLTYGSTSVGDYFKDMMSGAEIVKTFDLSENSKIGKYINDIINDPMFPEHPIVWNIEDSNHMYWNGASVSSGVYVSMGEDMTSITSNDMPIKSFDEYVTLGWERYGVLFPNILNLEFLFDDDTTSEYEMCRYFGVYADTIDISNAVLDLEYLYDNRHSILSTNTSFVNELYNVYDDVSFDITGKDTVKLPFISDALDFSCINSSIDTAVYVINDKDGYFNRLSSYDGVVANILSSSIDIGKLIGPYNTVLEPLSEPLYVDGHSSTYIEFRSDLSDSTEIHIYHSSGSFNDNDGNGNYDKIVALDPFQIIRRSYVDNTTASALTIINSSYSYSIDVPAMAVNFDLSEYVLAAIKVINPNYTIIDAVSSIYETNVWSLVESGQLIYSTSNYLSDKNMQIFRKSYIDNITSSIVSVIDSSYPYSIDVQPGVINFDLTSAVFNAIKKINRSATIADAATSITNSNVWNLISTNKLIYGTSNYISDPGSYYSTLLDVTVGSVVKTNNVYFINRFISNTKTSVADAIASCINGMNSSPIKAYTNGNRVYFVSVSKGYFDDDYKISFTYKGTDNEIYYNGGLIQSGGVVKLTGGTNGHSRFMIPSSQRDSILSNIDSLIIKTTDGWARIKSVSWYSDDIVSKTNSNQNITDADAVKYEAYSVVAVDSKYEPISVNNRYIISSVFVPKISVLSIYGFYDIDFDFFSTKYSKYPEWELYKYFYMPNNVSSYSDMLSGMPSSITSTDTGNGYSIIDTLSDSQYNNVDQEWNTGNFDYMKWLSAKDKSGDISNFNGFYTIRDIFGTSQTRDAFYDYYGKFHNGELSSEYSMFRENYASDFAYRSIMSPYICKFGHALGTDARNNPYRLNTSIAFGIDNMTPNFSVRVPDPSNMTHEWLYLVADQEELFSIEKINASNYCIFNKQLDIDALMNGTIDFYDYFIYTPSIGNTYVNAPQHRYSTIKYNKDIGLCETLFRGVMLRFKDESGIGTGGDGKPTFTPESTRFDGYVFSGVIVPIKDDILNYDIPPIDIKVYCNDDKKFIIFVVYVALESNADVNEQAYTKYTVPGSASFETLFGTLDYNFFNVTEQYYANTINRSIPTIQYSQNRVTDKLGNPQIHGFETANGDYRIGYSNTTGLFDLSYIHMYSMRHKKTSIFSVYSTVNTDLTLNIQKSGNTLFNKVYALNKSGYIPYTYDIPTFDTYSNIKIPLRIFNYDGDVAGILPDNTDSFTRFEVTQDVKDGLVPEWFESFGYNPYIDFTNMQDALTYGLYFKNFNEFGLLEQNTAFYDMTLVDPNNRFEYLMTYTNKYNVGFNYMDCSPYYDKLQKMVNDSIVSRNDISSRMNIISATNKSQITTFNSTEVGPISNLLLCGGKEYYSYIFSRISFSNIMDYINKMSNMVKYVYSSAFYIEVMDKPEISKSSIVIPIQDPDKPDKYKSENIVGYAYTTHPVNDMRLYRYGGGYSPIFNDIVSFSPKSTVCGTDIMHANIEFNPQSKDFGIIQNFPHVKVSGSKILSLQGDSKYSPVYPLIGEYNIGFADMNAFMSNWEYGFHVEYADKNTFSHTFGLRRIENDDCLVNTVTKLPDTMTFNVKSLIESNIVNKNSQILTSINLSNMITSFLSAGMHDNINSLINVSEDELISCIGNMSIDSYISSYVSVNFTKYYAISEVRMYMSSTTGTGNVTFTDIDEVEAIKSGYSLFKSVDIKKNGTLGSDITINKLTGRDITIAPIVKIKFI